jgi:type IV pilus assembly protein PilF
MLGLVLLMTGCAQPQAQAAHLDTLTTPPPDTVRQRASRRLVLATAYFEQNQTAVAQQEVRAALQIDPNYAEAYSLLGLIHQRNNAPGLAEQSFEQALQLAVLSASPPSELAAVQHNYGWFLCQQNDFARAQTQFARALSQPAYAAAAKTWTTSALCQLHAGQRVEAQNSFQQVLRIEPGNALVRYQLAELNWQDGNPRQARAMLSPLNASPQATPESLWLGIQLARALAQASEMQQLGQQLTQRYPQSTQAKSWVERKFEDK